MNDDNRFSRENITAIILFIVGLSGIFSGHLISQILGGVVIVIMIIYFFKRNQWKNQ